MAIKKTVKSKTASVTGAIRMLAGDDEFAIKQAADKLTQELMPPNPFNFETIDAQAENVEGAVQKINTLREAVLTLPFGNEQKLVWWKNVNFLGDTVTGRSAQVTENLEKLTEVLKSMDSASVKLIISAIGVDKRRTFYKSLQSMAEVRLFELPDPRKADPDEAIMQIEAAMRQHGLKPAPGAAARLFDATGYDTRAQTQEIEKLFCYLDGGAKPLTVEIVQGMVASSREAVIWDFCDTVLSGHAEKAIQHLHQLLEQDESEVGIIILLGNQIRQAALVSTLMENNLARLTMQGNYSKLALSPEAEELIPKKKSGEPTSPYLLARIAERARRHPSSFWVQGVERVHDTYRQLLTTTTDKARPLELLVLQLAKR